MFPLSGDPTLPYNLDYIVFPERHIQILDKANTYLRQPLFQLPRLVALDRFDCILFPATIIYLINVNSERTVVNYEQ